MVSVVLPAHNEAAGIEECVRCLLTQTRPVDEIIVVDNASTDDTADRVRRAAGGDRRVRVLREDRPGVAFARYTGFAAASGDVIASIDGDTLVGPGWADAVSATFRDHPEVMAGTAPMIMWDLPFQGVYRRAAAMLEAAARRGLARGRPLRVPGLSGANSAIRRTAWEEIAHDVTVRGDVFEDLDRWLLLRARGHHAILVPGMSAVVSGRRLLTGPRDLARYLAAGPRTFLLHDEPGLALVSAVGGCAELVRVTLFLPVLRAWVPATRSFDVRRAFRRDRDLPSTPVRTTHKRSATP